MIHVCFGLHDKTGRYSKFTGTTLTSIFENTTAEVTAHILHDNTLTADNREKFSRLAQRYNQCIQFYNVEKICANKIAEFWRQIPEIKTAWSTIGTFFKLLIPKVLPVEMGKIIYLDSDIIVNLDIKELWQIELGNKTIAAVPEILASPQYHRRSSQGIISDGFVEFENYFNAGVFVMNLEYLRTAEELLMSGVKWRGEHPQCNCFDQDIWNYLFSKNYLRLPAQFNVFVRDARIRGENKIEKVIYHYAGRRLGLESDDIFNRLWFKHFMQSLWCDEEVFGRLYEKFQTKETEIKNLLISLTSALKGRDRAFISFAEYVEPIKFVFNAQNDELLVIENFKDMPHLINTLKNLRGQRVFLIMIPNYPLLHDHLTTEGFVENKDFFDGTKFLSKAHGWQIVSSYKFIREM